MKIVKLKKSIWVIGDVHGKYDKLKELLTHIPINDNICFVGDLIDRGRDSEKVINLIRKRNYYVVKGNHEKMAYNDYSQWIQEGGKITISSYTKKLSYEINYKEEYQTNQKLIEDIKWFKTLPTIMKFEIDGELPLYVSHSGLKLFKTDKEIEENNSEYEILWNRITKEEIDFAINIYGHSPQKEIFKNKSSINIDTGANIEDYPLTAINYPSFEIKQSKGF